MQYWLMKSEPDAFSIDDLITSENQITHWDGIRNYQARNFMRDKMEIGDKVLFYHSNCKPPGVVGVMEVCSEPYPDFTAWDETSKYFDPKSSPENPRWMMVDVKFVAKFDRQVSLPEIKDTPELAGMLLIKKGVRLSIQTVEEQEFQKIVELGQV